MMLADLGADVVKIEPPDGDAFRRFGRTVDGRGIMWANVNRAKRAAVLDLKSSEGHDELLEMLAGADVFLTNWRPGVAEALGLTAPVVRQTSPALVWCRVSGFGASGPLADGPAFDSLIQARTGTMHAQGASHGAPDGVRGFLADKVTALLATQAILAALVGRVRTGTGVVLDVSMLDALAYFNGPDLMSERTLLADSGRDALSEQLKAVRCVRTADGWICVSPVRGKQLKGMASAAGHPEWIDELRTINEPAARTQRLYALLASVTASATTEVWLQRFAANDVPAAPVLDLDAHLADPQVAHNHTYAVYDDPVLGRIRQPRHPARWDGFVPPDPKPAPL
jgi:crotonobetainyl-CoA:carnitine CoA-transferase CaiB-like acyl-CoA transferase